MASAAQAGGGNSDENDLACVYRAVDEGASAEQVRAILAGGSRTGQAYDEWLAAVLEYRGGLFGETPLQRAQHGRLSGPVVGALLEHGAKARALGRNAHPLAICIAYGQADSLRVLLRSGRHSADEELAYGLKRTVAGADADDLFLGGLGSPLRSCRPVHLCVVPPRLSQWDRTSPPPQIECLNVLVREFGADVNKPDEPNHRTPLHWLSDVSGSRDERRAFDALMALGADLNVPDCSGRTFVFQVDDPERLQQILERGASPNVILRNGDTPLSNACLDQNGPLVAALLPVTSTETRRAVGQRSRASALDWLLAKASLSMEPWVIPAIEELLSTRVPVHPESAADALPFAARLAERRAAEAAAHANDPPTWQVHEAMVGLAFDRDMREVDEAVRRREARVAELEEELRARGTGGAEEASGSGGGGE